MRRIKIKHIIFFLRIVLGVLFIYASYDKILNPWDFGATIRDYKMLPAELTNLPALFLPWLEFYCGLFLLLGVFIRSSALLISCMLIVFIIALGQALLKGLDINCGCYGGSNKIAFMRIVEDLLLLVISVTVMYSKDHFAAIENIWKRKGNEA